VRERLQAVLDQLKIERAERDVDSWHWLLLNGDGGRERRIGRGRLVSSIGVPQRGWPRQ